MRKAHPITCLPFQCPHSRIPHSRVEASILKPPFSILHSGPTLIPEVALPSDISVYSCGLSPHFLFLSLSHHDYNSTSSTHKKIFYPSFRHFYRRYPHFRSYLNIKSPPPLLRQRDNKYKIAHTLPIHGSCKVESLKLLRCWHTLSTL